MRWHNPSPQSGLPWSSLGFHRTNLTTTQVVGPLLLRRPRIRFIGNGRLVRNAVGSRYYLTSLSASYLTTLGAPGRIRTVTAAKPRDFRTTPCYHGRRSVVVWTFSSPCVLRLGARRQVSTRSSMRLRSGLSQREFPRI